MMMWFKLMIMRASDAATGIVVGAAAMVLALMLGWVTVPVAAPVVAAETSVPAVAVQVSRENVPTDDSPFYGVLVAEDDDMADVLPESGAPRAVEMAAYDALLNAGARGAVTDSIDQVFVRVGRVVDFGYGTVTVTIYGPAICVDNAARACTGGEFLTDHYLMGV